MFLEKKMYLLPNSVVGVGEDTFKFGHEHEAYCLFFFLNLWVQMKGGF